ncbi:16055_t:CDS:2 [Entrophospora sp. SA101]|nr:16055_t:CDS:2 [Entrophospora sp. SA101]
MIVFSDDDESNKLDLKRLYGRLKAKKLDNLLQPVKLKIERLDSIQNRFIIAFMNDLNTQIPVGTNHKYYYELILLLLSMQNIWNSINYQVEEMKVSGEMT